MKERPARGRLDKLHGALTGFMGVVALFASGCGVSGLDTKPAHTVTVTAPGTTPPTSEKPRAPQTVRVTETVTKSPSPSKKNGTVSGEVICGNGLPVVGMLAEGANKASSGRVSLTPTDEDPSVADFEMELNGVKVKVAVGCGGKRTNWKTTSHTGYTDFSSMEKDQEEEEEKKAEGGQFVITCSPNGNNGWCEVEKK